MYNSDDLINLYRKLRPLQILTEEITAHNSTDSTLNFSLTVLTYNLLAQHHINSLVYPYCSPGVLRSFYRRTRLIAELTAYAPFDIAAFQEVGQYETFWREELERDDKLKGIFAAKEGGKDGLCILYNTQKYKLIIEEVISFAPLMTALEAVPNIAQLIVLSPLNKTKTQFESPHLIVTNTHLFWRPDFDCLRVLQAHRLRKRIEEIKIQFPRAIILMCGDWNSDPKSAVYFLTTAQLNKIVLSDWNNLIKSHSDLLNHSLESSQNSFNQVLEDYKHWTALTSAYSLYKYPIDPSIQQEPPYTSINSYVDTLDYIFTDFERLRVAELLMLPPDEIVRGQTALPNQIYSSDHLALMAKFHFKS